MKTNLKIGMALCLIVLFVTSLSSCKKDKEEKKEPNFSAIADNALADRIFGDVFNQSGKAVKDAEEETGNKSGNSILTGCPTLTISPFDLTWPKQITVDFGTTDCLGTDGHNRRGIINIHATEGWRMPGAVTTISFNNFYYDNHKVEGTNVFTNNGRNADSNLVYLVVVQNGKITKPDNTFITWASSREHEWIEGEPTILNPYDDGYMITGSYSGVSSGGETYTIDIISELYFHMSCMWLRQGIIDINIQGVPTIRVDYGDGTCDAFADVIYEGATYPLVMQ
ncbi:MAG: hypothetical protein PHT69_14315 [Bacteroidales bacterium]|nr:hypothetical protein [Bacteroidales bacterium]